MRYTAIFLLAIALFIQIPFHSVSAEPTVSAVLDIDGNGQKEPLSDGLLILRYLFDFRGDSLIDQAVGSGATRTSATDIEAYLSNQLSTLDIDGDGVTEPLSDGLLILRYLFDFRGSALISQAVGIEATRKKSLEIEEYIKSLLVADSSLTISGYSYKGIISNAVIEIYDFTENTKGSLLSSGTIVNSKFTIDKVESKNTILIEVKKNVSNTAYYIDESNSNKVIFNDLVLRSIIDSPKDTESYVITPLTTFATELVLSSLSSNADDAYQMVSKLFGLSFADINKVKPNIEGIETSSKNSTQNEYAVALLSLVAYLNEINSGLDNNITAHDFMNIIMRDLSDGVFDGKEDSVDITITDGGSAVNTGDIPIRLSKAGEISLSKINSQLFDSMRGYFLRLATASRVIKPPVIGITGNKNIRINEKSFFSAETSNSFFGYPLAFSWSVKNSPSGSSGSFIPATGVNSFLTVSHEGNYTISLEVFDGQNRVVEDWDIIADLDGDGLLSPDDPDTDGDGILNVDDKFPVDSSEFLDSDNDGTGNYTQQDEDGDGDDDLVDDYPFDSSKSQITIFDESEFNGNLNDANNVIGQPPYKVSGIVNANGSDDDYFKFTSTAGAILSIALTKTYIDFEPILGIVDNSGNPIPSVSSIEAENTTILSFRAPIDGSFTLIVTDKESRSNIQNSYIASVFIDSDMDGVSDKYEEAIGSNKKSSDTDSDGIKDYYEIYSGSFDIDDDGVPNWLDHDSDGDSIPDSKENLVDYDGDGILNPYDTDSDGNGIIDIEEVGSNPLEPLDSDGDTYANYYDVDDDNDGVLDINDDNRLVASDVNNALFIDLYGVINTNKISNFAQSLGVLGIAGDSFSSGALVVLVNASGVYNLSPTEISEKTIKVSLPEMEGMTEVRVYNDSKLSVSSFVDIVAIDKPVIFELSYPNSQNYSLEGDSVTLNGINLSSITNVKINNTSVDTTSTTDTTIIFDVIGGLQSGSIVASTLNGDSNSLPIFVGREISGIVELPQGSSYSFSDLKIKLAGIESSVNSDGSYSLVVRNNNSSSVTIFTPQDSNGNISVYLSALVLASNDNTNVVVNTHSTAIDIMFSAFNGEYADASRKREMHSIISDNIVIFSNNLKQNIGSDPYYISRASDEYLNALSESKTIIYNEFIDNSIVLEKKIKMYASGIKVNEISGFTVFKDGDPINGKVEIQNDTMLFADYQIKNLQNGKISKHYNNQFYSPDLLGPQYSGFFLYLSNDVTKDVSFQSSQVTIVTPKFRGMDFSNFNKRPEYKLAIRTLISQGIIPIVSEIVPFPGGSKFEKTLSKVLLLGAINGPAIDYWANGEVGKGFVEYLRSIIDSLRDASVQAALKSELVGIFTDEYIAKAATKLLGFAVPTKAISVAGTAVDLGWVVIDFAAVDDKIAINVNFPITVDEIYPSSIRKNSSREIYIEGKGLDKYCLDYDLKFVNGFTSLPENVCVSWHYPKVLLTNNKGDFNEVNLIKLSGNKYRFYIPEELIDSDTSKIEVKIEHIHNDEQDLNEEILITVDAPNDITIVDKTSISNITPNSGGINTRVTISGTGFSNDPFENWVYFTTANGRIRATVASASESQVEAYVPKGAVTGDVWVVVDDDESNKLPFSISTQTITIEFGDNGSANDDTFALEFDGKVIKTMVKPARVVRGKVGLEEGKDYTVKLKGITAPDDIGTYYIKFPSQIEVISGDYLSGSDLTAGVIKSWSIRLRKNTSQIKYFSQTIKLNSSYSIKLQAE